MTSSTHRTSLSISPVTLDDEAWLVIDGAVDFVTATQLADALRNAERDQPAVIGLDMSALTFMDSSCVHLLVSANQRARRAGRRLVVSRPSYPARRVMEITRLDRQIELLP